VIAPMTLEADDRGIRISMSSTKADLEWPTFKSFLETSTAFILQTGVTSHFIPKRGMSVDQDRAFRVLLLRQHELTGAANLRRWAIRAIAGVGAALLVVLGAAMLAMARVFG
jgi:hypothetical protein